MLLFTPFSSLHPTIISVCPLLPSHWSFHAFCLPSQHRPCSSFAPPLSPCSTLICNPQNPKFQMTISNNFPFYFTIVSQSQVPNTLCCTTREKRLNHNSIYLSISIKRIMDALNTRTKGEIIISSKCIIHH